MNSNETEQKHEDMKLEDGKYTISDTKSLIDTLEKIERKEADFRNKRFDYLVWGVFLAIITIIILVFWDSGREYILKTKFDFFYSEKVVGTYIAAIMAFLISNLDEDNKAEMKAILYKAFSNNYVGLKDVSKATPDLLDKAELNKLFNEIIQKKLKP